MKFKAIFLLFNLLTLLAFALIAFMPVFVLGWEYTQVFWQGNWYFVVIFIAILGGLNIYFGLNWKLFSLLEKEDWEGLSSLLETRIYEQNKISRQHLRLLINSYVVRSHPEKILNLEQHVLKHAPQLRDRFALSFAVPRLLSNDPDRMLEYFETMSAREEVPDREWMLWGKGFALMLAHRADEAREVLLTLAASVADPVLKLLTLYLLDAYRDVHEEAKRIVDEGKRALSDRYDMKAWQKEVNKHRGNLQVLVLSKLVRDATNWAFRGGKSFT